MTRHSTLCLALTTVAVVTGCPKPGVSSGGLSSLADSKPSSAPTWSSVVDGIRIRVTPSRMIEVENRGKEPRVVLPWFLTRTYRPLGAGKAGFVAHPGPYVPWAKAFLLEPGATRVSAGDSSHGEWRVDPGEYALAVRYALPPGVAAPVPEPPPPPTLGEGDPPPAASEEPGEERTRLADHPLWKGPATGPPLRVKVPRENLEEARRNGNETACIGALKTISTAQALFREGDKDNNGVLDYAADLAALTKSRLLDAMLGSGKKNGYTYKVCRGSAAPEFLWMAVASPIELGKTGSRHFAINHEGVIFYNGEKPIELDTKNCVISGGTPVGR